jgi:hypothetical protein
MKNRDKEKKDLQKTVKIVGEVVENRPQGYLSTGVRHLPHMDQGNN